MMTEENGVVMDFNPKETGRFAVMFTRDGKQMATVCVTIAGYSTIDDVPRMVRIKYGAPDVKIEIDSITRITEGEGSDATS